MKHTANDTNKKLLIGTVIKTGLGKTNFMKHQEMEVDSITQERLYFIGRSAPLTKVVDIWRK